VRPASPSSRGPADYTVETSPGTHPGLESLSGSPTPELLDAVTRLLDSRLADGGVAVFLGDPGENHLEVATAAGLPAWLFNLALPADPTSNPVAWSVHHDLVWPDDGGLVEPPSAGGLIGGLAQPLRIVIPLSASSHRRPHGALVAFSEGPVDAGLFAAAGRMLGLALDAEARTDRPPSTVEEVEGVTDAGGLVDLLSSSTGPMGVLRVEICPGPFRPSGSTVPETDLAVIAESIRSVVRPADVVAHLGRGEFVVVVRTEEVPQAEETLNRLAERLAFLAEDSASCPVSQGSVSATITTAAGPTGSSVRDLIEAARNGGDREISLHSSGSTAVGVRAGSSVTGNGDVPDRRRLLEALDREEIAPFYQPQFDLHTMATTGVEALARWRTTTGEVISPACFIGPMEEEGLMPRLTALMLRRAISDAVEWRDAGLLPPGFKVSVNISMSDLADDLLPPLLTAMLEQYGLEPSTLALEITETEAMADVHQAIGMMKELKAVGVGLAIDDFGTGYSSLEYLSRLPVDLVKIDRSFVQRIASSRGDEAIVAAVVDVAAAVGVGTLAEGVETESELRQLRGLGVQQGQGFLVSPAIPAEELGERLAAERTAGS